MSPITPPSSPPTPLKQGWAGLPAAYRFWDQTPTLTEARQYCQHLAESHYENFHVASWFLPKAYRSHLYAIYAYCRISDDLADEVGDTGQSLDLLNLWGAELDACYEGRLRHPVFVALSETIRECGIPKEPFANLLIAFRQDQTVTRYPTREDLLGYCKNSANPVGRLVLYAFGEVDDERVALSDATCTALQLANFWQDVRRDYTIGRVYLPQQDMARFGVSEDLLARGEATPAFRALIRDEVAYARSFFEQGLPLIGKVNRDLGLDLDLFSRGGLEILNAIEAQDFDVLSRRPKLSKGTKLKLALRAFGGKLLPGLQLKRRTKRKVTA